MSGEEALAKVTENASKNLSDENEDDYTDDDDDEEEEEDF